MKVIRSYVTFLDIFGKIFFNSIKTNPPLLKSLPLVIGHLPNTTHDKGSNIGKKYTYFNVFTFRNGKHKSAKGIIKCKFMVLV